ncbi:MAG: DUF2911 domain-containing protein [Thermoanaerobaculia bacterium]
MLRSCNALFAVAVALVLAAPAVGQEDRPASPRGEASTQVGGEWVTQENGRTRYEGGQWLDVDYGRPILRGREDVFGSGESYGEQVLAGAPVWRAGANQTTRLSTEAPLVIGGERIEPGEYSLFVDLAEDGWTLIVSSQPHQETFSRDEEVATWGAYRYDPEYDVVRAPMTMDTSEHTIDQFTILFVDVTAAGGKLAMAWEDTVAVVPFEVAGEGAE